MHYFTTVVGLIAKCEHKYEKQFEVFASNEKLFALHAAQLQSTKHKNGYVRRTFAYAYI